MRVNENILISSLTTMRLGGPASHVIEIESPEEIPDAYGFADAYGLPTFPLGSGANTIGHDEGFNGVIIINRMRGIYQDGQRPTVLSNIEKFLAETPINASNAVTTLRIMGGEPWDNVVEYACARGFTGIEALSRIPGLTAAAPIQNIGAYGQEIADTIVSVDVYDTTSHTFRTLLKPDLKFAYRQSILNTTERGRYFVIAVTLQLHQGQMSRPFYNSIERYISDHSLTDFTPMGIRNIVSQIRAGKLPDPLVQASSGSFFKNIYVTEEEAERIADKGFPVHQNKQGYKINTAWLIEQASLKGQLLHGMRVSPTAPLVLINESAKSFADLAKAREEIVAKIYDKFGYWLEQEPVEITNPKR